VGDRIRTSPVRFSGEFERGLREISPPIRARKLARASLGGCAQAQSQPNPSSAPPTKLRIFPDTLTSSPCCYGPTDGSLSRDGLAGPRPEIPFLSLVLTGIPLNFGIHAVQSSAGKPSRNYDFSSGLAAFWFLWTAGGSVAPQCRQDGFSCCCRALIKMTGSFFPQAAAGFVLFSSACAGWLIQTASEPSESPL